MSSQRISINSATSVANRPYAGDKWTPLLALGAAVSTFGFAVPAGYCLGVLNTPAKPHIQEFVANNCHFEKVDRRDPKCLLEQWCNETLVGERDVSLSKPQLDILWSLIVSVFLIGGVVGGLTGAWFADRLGRKGTLISGNVLNVVSGLLFLCSKFVPSVEMFFVGRIIVGFIAGLMTTVVPMYLTELSPPKLSGLLGVLFPLGLTFGILVSQIMGLDWILGTETLWPYLVSGYSVMSIFVFISLPWLPESPKYLYQIVKEEDKAMQELSRLRNLPTSVVAWEIASNKSSPRRSTQDKWSLIRVLTTPRLRIPLSLVIALQAGQQLSGINAIFYFSSNIFETAGLTKEEIPYANIGTGCINFIITACGTLLVNTFGRRPLLIFSCSLTSLTLILLTLSSKYMDLAPWIPYLSVAIVLAFVLCYDLGLGPIPYFIGTELVDIGPRPVIMALGSVANWGGNFLVGASYTTLHNWLHESIFLGFAFLTALLMIFIMVYLPETKDRPMSNEELVEEQHITEE